MDKFLNRLQRAERRDELRITGYHVLGLISTGSFSRVYRAVCKDTTRRRVAIKVFKRRPDAIDSYHREVEAYELLSSELSSEFVVAFLYAHCNENIKRAYIVMELGKISLRRHMHSGRIGVWQTSSLIRQLVHGIRYVHSVHLAHRDLKPDNLLLDDDGCLKICDFGMAARVRDDARLHTVCGTPCYMAPEIFRKGGYDEKVDVWAIGVIVYELLHAGTIAFYAPTMHELVRRIRNGTHAPFRHDLPHLYRRFLQRCLQTDPTERWSIHALPVPVPKRKQHDP